MTQENKDGFSYTYSAAQAEEIKRIREKYVPRECDRMEQLRKLDRSVTKPGRQASITVGVISCLVLGLGMSCAMVWAGPAFIPGIIIGAAGLLGVASAYPLYCLITRKQREKLTPQILRLTQELMSGRQ